MQRQQIKDPLETIMKIELQLFLTFLNQKPVLNGKKWHISVFSMGTVEQIVLIFFVTIYIFLFLNKKGSTLFYKFSFPTNMK